MKDKSSVCVLIMVFHLGLVHAAQVIVPTFTTLHSFSGRSDGAGPRATLILSGATLYGTTSSGGLGYGTVFAVNTNGAGFLTLHNFSGPTDGSNANAAMVLSGNTLYGAAYGGGINGNGTLFALNTNGTGFRVLHTFGQLVGSRGAFGFPTNADGAWPAGWSGWPDAGPILCSNVLYGTAAEGGSFGQGTIFALNTNGTGFTVLHHFTGGTDGGGPSGLLLSSNILCGTGEGRESCYPGTVFSLNTNGTSFKTLYSFPGLTLRTEPWPVNRLALSGNSLYGTTQAGGSNAKGSVFRINIDGTDFTNLHSFSNLSSTLTNTDGAQPAGGLVLGTNTLYGATSFGGQSATGTVFQLDLDGTSFITLYNFSPSNGAPNSGLLLSGNTLYGTTISGGSADHGTVFGISLVVASSPEITSQPLSRTNIAGSTASFSVVATGTAPLFYEWFEGSSPMPQRSGATLMLTNVSNAAAAVYSVVITNVAGSVTSAPARLVVLDPPKIGTQPLSRTNVAGSLASFSVAATGTSPLSYQWQKGSAVLAKQRSPTLTLTNVTDVDAGMYSVIITNVAGTVNSAPASLTVIDQPKLSLVRTPGNALLSWSITPVSFSLLSATNLAPPILWTPVFPQPVVRNGQNVVTNPFVAPQRFYRLSY